jgi:NAD(P)-dependent dehydrogenase (short-subunit alcohol dehydrogenase family)
VVTPQVPIGSGFDASSTAAEVIDGVDLTGSIAVVTGGHAGLGVETVRALRGVGATVIAAARDTERAARGLDGIADVEIARLDLTDPASIDDFIADFIASERPLHILVNNAGIMMVPLARDTRGYESQFATNHVGHFQLTVGLWPALQRADGARVVAVSSWGHRHSDIVWDDVQYDSREYDALTSYGQSKTANNLFAVEVDRRGHDDGIRGFALHPGSIVTSVAQQLSTEDLQALGLVDEDGEPIIDPSRNMKSPAQGAATSVWCAASPQLDGMGGVYCENCDIAPLVGDADEAEIREFGSRPLGVMPYSVDPESAARLWDLSHSLIS